MENRFKVVFEKLHEASSSVEESKRHLPLDTPDQELDEIRELCRLSALVSDPESTSYTST